MEDLHTLLCTQLMLWSHIKVETTQPLFWLLRCFCFRSHTFLTSILIFLATASRFFSAGSSPLTLLEQATLALLAEGRRGHWISLAFPPFYSTLLLLAHWPHCSFCKAPDLFHHLLNGCITKCLVCLSVLHFRYIIPPPSDWMQHYWIRLHINAFSSQLAT